MPVTPQRGEAHGRWMAVACGCMAGSLGIAHAWGPPVTYQYNSDPEASHLEVDFGLGFPFGGSLIGDFDAKSNPEGTRTVAGAAGGGGGDTNEPIPVSADLEGSISADGVPTASMEIVVGAGPAGWIRDLTFELTDSTSTGVDLDVSLEWDTFRTFNPFFLYPGGIPFTLPLPVLEATSVRYAQGEMASALLIPTGLQRRFLLAVVPGTVTIEGTMLGEPVTLEASFPVPIFGELEFAGGGFSLDVGIDVSGSFEIPLPLPSLPAVPLALPTAPGQLPANVLLTAQLEGFSGNALIDAEFSGSGQPTFAISDLNEDGVVGGIDLNDLLAAWGPDDGTPEHEAADINRDGVVDGLDLMFVMGQWSN